MSTIEREGERPYVTFDTKKGVEFWVFIIIVVVGIRHVSTRRGDVPSELGTAQKGD